MPEETTLTTAIARLGGIPFRLLGRRPFTPPQKAVILQPCCISQVMLTTPLLAALRRAYPQARFDWAVSDWARPAIAGNPLVAKLISAGPGSVRQMTRAELQALARRLQAESYDTCIIPGRSAWLAWLAWRAGIPQRIGLNVNGRGFAHTLPVSPPSGERHAAAVYLALAKAMQAGAEWTAGWETAFYPADEDRTAVTQMLLEELGWEGKRPLAILHPGGGVNPAIHNEQKRWPVERFARLGNHLAQRRNAHLILVGDASEASLIHAMMGMMSVPAIDWSGRLSLGKLGALAELADLYVGNDTGTTHVAAAVGCPVIAVFGPTDPALSAPYAPRSEKVVVLWRGGEARPFTWENGVTVKEAVKAADKLLAQKF